jgi:hypothetical protein
MAISRYGRGRWQSSVTGQVYNSEQEASAAENAFKESDTGKAIDKLTQQILGQGTTSQWSGEGFGSAEANARDMAKILSGIGINDIKQFGEVKKYEPVEQLGFTYNGMRAQNPSPGLYYVEEPREDGEGGTYFARRDLSAEEAKQVKPVYGVYAGSDENGPIYNTNIDQSTVTTKNGQTVAEQLTATRKQDKLFPTRTANARPATLGVAPSRGAAIPDTGFSSARTARRTSTPLAHPAATWGRLLRSLQSPNLSRAPWASPPELQTQPLQSTKETCLADWRP